MFPGGVKLRNCVKPAYDVLECLQGHIIWVAHSDRALWSRPASEMPSHGAFQTPKRLVVRRNPFAAIRRKPAGRLIDIKVGARQSLILDQSCEGQRREAWGRGG